MLAITHGNIAVQTVKNSDDHSPQLLRIFNERKDIRG
jgi:hypothetical protein